jgi:hypothetical protein
MEYSKNYFINVSYDSVVSEHGCIVRNLGMVYRKEKLYKNPSFTINEDMEWTPEKAAWSIVYNKYLSRYQALYECVTSSPSHSNMGGVEAFIESELNSTDYDSDDSVELTKEDMKEVCYKVLSTKRTGFDYTSEDVEVEEADGSDVEADGSDVEADGSDVEADGSDVEADGSDVEVEEADGSDVEVEEADGSDVDLTGFDSDDSVELTIEDLKEVYNKVYSTECVGFDYLSDDVELDEVSSTEYGEAWY